MPIPTSFVTTKNLALNLVTQAKIPSISASRAASNFDSSNFLPERWSIKILFVNIVMQSIITVCASPMFFSISTPALARASSVLQLAGRLFLCFSMRACISSSPGSAVATKSAGLPVLMPCSSTYWLLPLLAPPVTRISLPKEILLLLF